MAKAERSCRAVWVPGVPLQTPCRARSPVTQPGPFPQPRPSSLSLWQIGLEESNHSTFSSH